MKADFVVVANRLPVDIIDHPNGEVEYRTSPGGLVTALKPVLQQHKGSWVGWPGTCDDEREPFDHDGLHLEPVTLSQRNYEQFYEGFSNATLWPLYHDLIVRPIYHRHWWEDYGEVNHQFALKVAQCAAEGATVWVQDYQLQLVPGILRQIRPDLRIGFFLHIPFPSPELFRQLPWREEILRGLLGADIVGFHTLHNAHNFLELARDVSGFARPSTGQPQNLAVSGRPTVGKINATIEASDGRRVGVGVFPISINSRQVAQAADAADRDAIRAELGNPKTLILGVDRLDYTKGILQRLEAFEELLATGALDPDDVVLYQVATPSRERIDHYKQARRAVEEAVGRINGQFGSLGHQVVHYCHRNVPFDQLVGLYRAADVMLITALKDGMNLVAKEYIASHSDGRGALVLSEFTGAAAELDGAYLCNPFDIDNVKAQLYQAIVDDPERKEARMHKLYDQVMTHDVHAWAASFLGQLDGHMVEGASPDSDGHSDARPEEDSDESAGSTGESKQDGSAGQRAATAIVDFDGKKHTVSWPRDQRLLDAMLDSGLDAPHGCTMGQCGACQCVVEGRDGATSHMVDNNVLDDYDIRDNMRLACQCLPDDDGTYDVSYVF